MYSLKMNRHGQEDLTILQVPRADLRLTMDDRTAQLLIVPAPHPRPLLRPGRGQHEREGTGTRSPMTTKPPASSCLFWVHQSAVCHFFFGDDDHQGIGAMSAWGNSDHRHRLAP